MSLVDVLLRRSDPVAGRAITPQQLAWDRGIDGNNVYGPAGVHVDRDSMLGISAVWACVSLIADSIATLPLGVFKDNSDGGPQSIAAPGWLDEPNPEQTLVDFKFGTVASLLLHGNAFIYTVRNQKQDIVEAWLLDPRWVYVRREYDENNQLALFYYVQVGKGMQSPVGPFRVKAGPEMFHIMAFQPSSSWPMGISPVDNARMLFGAAIAGQEMGTRFFSQGMNAAGVIESQEDMTPEQARQLKQDFKDANTGGPRKMHYPPVLTGGAQWKQIQISPEQSQFLQQRQFSVDEIARWFRVPPHMIGNLEKTSSWGAGIEQQSIGFVTYTLRPWLTRIERSWTDHMLMFQKGAYFSFDTTDLLRGDMAALGDFMVKAHMTGAMNDDEMRAKFLRMGPLPDGQGKVYYFPVNTAPIGTEPIRLDKPQVDIPGADVQAVENKPAAGSPAAGLPADTAAEANSVTFQLPTPRVEVNIGPELREFTDELRDTLSSLDDSRRADQEEMRRSLDESRVAFTRQLQQMDESTRTLLKSHGVSNMKQIDALRAELAKPEKPTLRKVTLPDGKTALLLHDGSERMLELPDGRRISISDLNGDNHDG